MFKEKIQNFYLMNPFSLSNKKKYSLIFKFEIFNLNLNKKFYLIDLNVYDENEKIFFKYSSKIDIQNTEFQGKRIFKDYGTTDFEVTLNLDSPIKVDKAYKAIIFLKNIDNQILSKDQFYFK